MPTKNLTDTKLLDHCFYSHWLMLCHWIIVFSICFSPSFSFLGWQSLGEQNFVYSLNGTRRREEGGGGMRKEEGGTRRRRKDEGGRRWWKKKKEEERRWWWCKGNFCIRSKIHLSKAPVSNVWKQVRWVQFKGTTDVSIQIWAIWIFGTY